MTTDCHLSQHLRTPNFGFSPCWPVRRRPKDIVLISYCLIIYQQLCIEYQHILRREFETTILLSDSPHRKNDKDCYKQHVPQSRQQRGGIWSLSSFLLLSIQSRSTHRTQEKKTKTMAVRSIVSRKTLAQTLTPALRHYRGLTTFTLPDLPYDYGALEPAISGDIMRLHHQKHHQTYVTNYNKALEQLESALAKGDTPAVVQLQSTLKFNGGG